MRYLFSILFVSLTLAAFGQKEWYGELELASVDCESHQACYHLNIKGVSSESWSLGDQNYRFFYDAERISILSVNSLLPTAYYSEPFLKDDFAIIGQGQEEFSPLDKIDQHLGFLNFSIVSYAKQNPAQAAQVKSGDSVAVAEICIQVTPEMMQGTTEEDAVQIYFSRPETAGQITQQYSLVSENHEENRTCETLALGFVDLDFNTSTDARLGELCMLLNSKESQLAKRGLYVYPNPAVMGSILHYESSWSDAETHSVLVYDSQARLVKEYQDLPAGNREIQLEKEMREGVWLFKVKTETREVVEEVVIFRL